MNRNLFEFFSKLLRELELHAVMFSLAKDSIGELKSKDFILVRRGNVGDYFLLTDVQASELHLVNRDMQTSLMSKLNSLLSDSSEGDLQPLSDVPVLKLNNHFEKNTNLLLFIQKTDGIDNMLSKITDVEEDEYFFKKQVVLLPSKFLDSIRTEETKSSEFTINEYLQKCMNDTKKFKTFISKPNSDTDYAGCAQLLEKLPFLHLDIHSSESNSLQNMIDSQIAENSEVYSLKTNSFDNDDSNLVILDKSLQDIHEAALEYVSKSEELDIELDAKSLLTKLQGNISHE